MYCILHCGHTLPSQSRSSCFKVWLRMIWQASALGPCLTTCSSYINSTSFKKKLSPLRKERSVLIRHHLKIEITFPWQETSNLPDGIWRREGTLKAGTGALARLRGTNAALSSVALLALLNSIARISLLYLQSRANHECDNRCSIQI